MAPLYNLLQKYDKYEWTSDYNAALQKPKYALVYALVLAMPYFNSDFVIETYASDMALGAQLMQCDRSGAFISKALTFAKCNYNPTDHELLAIVFAYKR